MARQYDGCGQVSSLGVRTNGALNEVRVVGCLIDSIVACRATERRLTRDWRRRRAGLCSRCGLVGGSRGRRCGNGSIQLVHVQAVWSSAVLRRVATAHHAAPSRYAVARLEG